MRSRLLPKTSNQISTKYSAHYCIRLEIDTDPAAPSAAGSSFASLPLGRHIEYNSLNRSSA